MKDIKVVDPGGIYLLRDVGSEDFYQEIQFVGRRLDENQKWGPIFREGVTEESVIKVLLDRLKTENEHDFFHGRRSAIEHLELALGHLISINGIIEGREDGE